MGNLTGMYKRAKNKRRRRVHLVHLMEKSKTGNRKALLCVRPDCRATGPMVRGNKVVAETENFIAVESE